VTVTQRQMVDSVAFCVRAPNRPASPRPAGHPAEPNSSHRATRAGAPAASTQPAHVRYRGHRPARRGPGRRAGRRQRDRRPDGPACARRSRQTRLAPRGMGSWVTDGRAEVVGHGLAQHDRWGGGPLLPVRSPPTPLASARVARAGPDPRDSSRRVGPCRGLPQRILAVPGLDLAWVSWPRRRQ
jgi:hypothetical protein